MPDLQVKRNGAWSYPPKIHANVGGVWTPVQKVFRNDSGVWTQHWPADVDMCTPLALDQYNINNSGTATSAGGLSIISNGTFSIPVSYYNVAAGNTPNMTGIRLALTNVAGDDYKDFGYSNIIYSTSSMGGHFNVPTGKLIAVEGTSTPLQAASSPLQTTALAYASIPGAPSTGVDIPLGYVLTGISFTTTLKRVDPGVITEYTLKSSISFTVRVARLVNTAGVAIPAGNITMGAPTISTGNITRTINSAGTQYSNITIPACNTITHVDLGYGINSTHIQLACSLVSNPITVIPV